MIIEKFDFNIYSLFIALAIIIPLIISTIYLLKRNIKKEDLLFSIILIIISSLTFGKYFTMATSSFSVSFENAGYSSYGGLLGMLIIVFYYSYLIGSKDMRNIYIVIIPLMYSISKLGCFFAGCCYGIPYDGFGAVKYPHVLDSYLFPIQLLEVTTFFILFLCIYFWFKKKNSKYIIEFTLISGSLLKGLLDFLRYSHINVIISTTQLVSVIIIFISCLSIFIRFKKIKLH